MFDLKQGTKEQLIRDFLIPDCQPKDYLDSPTYKGLQYLLETHLNDSPYYVYDPEMQNDNENKAQEFVDNLYKKAPWKNLSHLKIGDTYHFVKEWVCPTVTVIAVSYHGCSYQGAQTIYFIQE
jgi:hypothetical protein